jgi:putative glycosyltransferase (TIGR04348 family)
MESGDGAKGCYIKEIKLRREEARVEGLSVAMKRPTAIIVCPTMSQGNNGNLRTARRWRRMLAPVARATIAARWTGEPAHLMVALHARRSADSIAAWQAAREQANGAERAPMIVVLTGTDLYLDIRSDARAQRSLQLADALVVLQDQGPASLPRAVRDKTAVIYQSGGRRKALAKTRRHLRAVMVGHLRDVKCPQTLFEAARLLRDRADIRIDHIGAALDPGYGRKATATARLCPCYRWLGALSHPDTLRRIQQAHVLINASSMEGGAHVVLEAVRAGTPVLASRIPGNVGMLGADYAGYFPCGDAAALARLMQRCRDEPGLLPKLRRQCRERAARFEPRREQQALQRLVLRLLPEARRAMENR